MHRYSRTRLRQGRPAQITPPPAGDQDLSPEEEELLLGDRDGSRDGVGSSSPSSSPPQEVHPTRRHGPDSEG